MGMSAMKPTSLEDQVAGLRALADFLEAHPKMHTSWESFQYSHFTDSAEEFAEYCRELGSGEKGETGTDHLTLSRDFGGDVKVSIWVAKAQTCEKVVTQETVTKLVPPPDVEMVEVTETVERVTWVCPPSFLDLITAQAKEAAAKSAHPAGKSVAA
jgi:hypothetical protein